MPSGWRPLALGFSRSAPVACERKAEVAELRREIASAVDPDQFTVVVGGKGVGKSTLIAAALNRQPGVVSVAAFSGASAAAIVADAKKAISRFTINFMGAIDSSAWVIWWHRCFFWQPPTVVIRLAGEREPGQLPANVGSAVDTLLKQGLRVVVETTDDSLAGIALPTLRPRVVEVDEMPREQLEGIPDLHHLLVALQEAGLRDLAWSVLGGCPAHYFKLLTEVRHDVTFVAETYMREQLRRAAMWRTDSVKDHPCMRPIYEQFKAADELPEGVLGTIRMPSPGSVLRVAVKRGPPPQVVLRPTSAAMRLVLRYDESGKGLDLDTVRAVLAREAALGTASSMQ